MDIDEIVEKWILYTQDSKTYIDYLSAWEIVDEITHKNPEKALEIVEKLIKRSPGNYILANIAAGPLEDLICYHSDRVINEIERLARQNPDFRLCLTGVWLNDSISNDIVKRITKYTGTIKNPL